MTKRKEGSQAKRETGRERRREEKRKGKKMKLRTRLEREKKDICTLHDPTGRIPKKLKEKKKKRTNY